MADLSVAVLVGRLTRDAELKYTNSGQAVCHFSVATNSRKKKGTEWVDEPNYWDVDLWGKQGENLNQYLLKGKLIAVEGTMRQDKWEQDGQPRMKILITANTVQLLGGGQSGGGQASFGGAAPTGGNTQGRPASSGGSWQQGTAAQPPEDFSDEIPF